MGAIPGIAGHQFRGAPEATATSYVAQVTSQMGV